MDAFLKDFDIAALLPQLQTFLGQIRFYLGLLVIAGPLIMGLFGLAWTYRPAAAFRSPLGYRSYYAGSSVQAWQYAQRIAGVTWMILGGGLFALGLIISLLFALMDVVTMATVALVYLCVELIGVVAGNVFVNKQLQKHFDKDGNPLR